jgi:hypothetical protein
MLRELVKAMRISNPNARAIGNQTKSTHWLENLLL